MVILLSSGVVNNAATRPTKLGPQLCGARFLPLIDRLI